MKVVLLTPSKSSSKKWSVNIDGSKTIQFGANGYDDYTIHKDSERKERYVERHKHRENWTKSGLYTAGFWSRWLLWNKPSLRASIKDTEQKFNLRIIRPSV
jgi:hypothetical protein